MTTRHHLISSLLASALVLLFLAGLGVLKYFQIQQAMAQHGGPPPTGVSTVTTSTTLWQETLVVPGRVRATRGTTLALQEGGIVRTITARDKTLVTEDELLLSLDTSVEEAQLHNANATLQRLQADAERAQRLKKRNAISQLDFDFATTSATSAAAEVERIEATISNKKLSAPFAGRLGIFQVEQGDFIAAGTPIVRLENTSSFEVDFHLPQNLLGQLPKLSQVTLNFSPLSETRITADVTKTGSTVSAQSLTIPARAEVSAEQLPDQLRSTLLPGTTIRVEVPSSEAVEQIVLPTSAIAYAPYGNSVYVVNQPHRSDSIKSVSRRTVQLGRAMHDQVPILAGLKVGEQVVSSGVFKLRQDAPVVIDNSIPVSTKSPATVENR
jgi:membrane fusion protein (multidrug efflux system)